MAEGTSDAAAPTAAELGFERFAATDGERVRRALVGYYGIDVGTDAAADALAVAWERWAEITQMANPAGYVFRIGQSKARPGTRWRRRRVEFPTRHERSTGDATDRDTALIDLFDALRRLRPDERAAVLLTKSYGYSYREVAELLDTPETNINNLVHRGIAKLRTSLETNP